MTETAIKFLTEADAQRYRNEFPIFRHTTYLNSCSLGPPSSRVIRALERYREDWSAYGAPAWWREWLPKLNEVKQRFASLIGADQDEVTVSHSISSALSSIASTFEYQKRQAVVCADLDFPTIPYQWLAKKRQGVSVRFARSPDRIRVPLKAYREAVDERVELIATSHVFFTTGYIQPIRELADLAHAKGAKIVVDGYHSVGVLPVNVKDLDVDFYVGGTLKWLLGGPGLTFIYVKRELISDLEPSITGWFSSAKQFDFDSVNLEWPPSADRLELGTPAMATAYAGLAGMEMILEADPGKIYHRLQILTDRVIERAQSDGYEIISPLDRSERGGIVMLKLKDPQETVAELARRRFTVDHRPGLLRVSPHFFNTLEDVDSFMDTLADIQGV